MGKTGFKNREVEYFEYQIQDKGKGPEQILVSRGDALFHAWGINCVENEYGFGNYSTAIIELDDGTILNIDCELVKFIS